MLHRLTKRLFVDGSINHDQNKFGNKLRNFGSRKYKKGDLIDLQGSYRDMDVTNGFKGEHHLREPSIVIESSQNSIRLE